jgi:mono/diheme cytochrome c family protein
MRPFLLIVLFMYQYCDAQLPAIRKTDTVRRANIVAQKPSHLQRSPDTSHPSIKINPNLRVREITDYNAMHAAAARNFTLAQARKPIVPIDADSGRLIFNQQCAACHQPEKKLVGPALKDVRKRVPGYVVYAYLKNPDSSIFKRSIYFQNLKKEYAASHPSFAHLNESQVKSVLSYMDQSKAPTSSKDNMTVMKMERAEITAAGMKAGETPIKLGAVRFAFTTDTVMQVGNNYVANLVLSSGVEVLKAQLEQIAKRNNPDSVFFWDKTLLKKYIAADLQAEDKATFKIEPVMKLGSRELDSNSYLSWSWSVQATKENPNAVLVVGLYFSNQKFTSFEESDNIDQEFHTVRVLAVKQSFFTKLGAFLSNNWQWLISVIVIPLVVWWWNSRKRGAKKATG